jgi:hypothetical protein
VNQFTTPQFWRHYASLPEAIQRIADKNYQFLRSDPAHPSLHFKEIEDGLWSARVGKHYRALAFLEEDGYYWFWIVSHTEYDRFMP